MSKYIFCILKYIKCILVQDTIYYSSHENRFFVTSSNTTAGSIKAKVKGNNNNITGSRLDSSFDESAILYVLYLVKE
jgi:hypothetical protein